MTGVRSWLLSAQSGVRPKAESDQTGNQDKRGAKLFAESKHSNRGDIGMTHQI
jgi:hypothetical protein